VEKDEFMSRTIEAALKLAVIAAIVATCFMIIKPFVPIVLWSIIIAVSLRPLQDKLATAMGGRGKLAAVLITLGGLALIILPAVLFAGSLVQGTKVFIGVIQESTLDISHPPHWLSGIPVVGEMVNSQWQLLTNDLGRAFKTFAPQIKGAAGWMVTASAGFGFVALQFIISMVIAGVFLASPAGGAALADQLFRKFTGDRSREYASMAIGTIRSVAMGVVGVSIIQGLLAGLGMVVAGFPHAGAWALVVLILGIVQIPVLPVLLGLAAYGFTIYSTTGAVAFLVWCILTGLSDNVLKPIFFGRGVDIPMLVILLGAIGGMLLFGIIGLFLGAIMLSLGYKICITWLAQD
jgi:predicted PurR-regulated permease PerM